MSVSCVTEPLDDDRACSTCGGRLVASTQTLPYIAPGPRVVELRDVPAWECVACGQVEVRLPERSGLERLVRTKVPVMADTVPQIAFKESRWRVLKS
jgi:YgiT-type zinc finger domain-containing protein